MSEQTFITTKEREACQKVAAAFSGLYDRIDIAVKDAGKYGFVKLYCFEPRYPQSPATQKTKENNG